MTRVEYSDSDSVQTVTGSPWTVHQRDARKTGSFLAEIADVRGDEVVPFLTSTITSPPYANLVDYGSDEQIGFGQSFEDYLDSCEEIFSETLKWTKQDGSLWIVADTMMARGEAGAPSQMVPLPFALSERATRAGWTLRDVIIWRKDRTRPWAAPGRLRNGFEYVLYFVKSTDFKHHVDRLRDLRGLKTWWVKYPERHNPWGMTPDNVWDIPIPIQGSWATGELRHACPFPSELVRRMVELSTDEGDVVFDPFSGSGMVPAVAESLGRKPLGTELNSDFCRVYSESVRPAELTRAERPLDVDAIDITSTLLELRVLKFPKALLSQIMRAGVDRSLLLGAIVIAPVLDFTPKASPYADIDCYVIVPDETGASEIEALSHAIERAAAQPPLSKWGVSSRIKIQRVDSALAGVNECEELSLYSAGRTWSASRKLQSNEVQEFIRKSPQKGIPPVLSNLHVKVEPED